MNRHHQILLKTLKQKTKIKSQGSSYMGTEKINYDIRVPQIRKIVKAFAAKTNLSQQEFSSLLASLSEGKSHQEFWMTGELLKAYPESRAQLKLSLIDQILDQAEGWAEVDSLCYNTFQFRDMLNNWSKWKEFLVKLNKNRNVHKRRASLVLLTGPTRYSDSTKLASLAIKNINNLKKEKDKLITKAISWLLRALIKHHRKLVEDYIQKNKDQLPAVAVRETTNKLKTGRK